MKRPRTSKSTSSSALRSLSLSASDLAKVQGGFTMTLGGGKGEPCTCTECTKKRNQTLAG
jgi:hypothetical protein